jgi:hypothetical protein
MLRRMQIRFNIFYKTFVLSYEDSILGISRCSKCIEQLSINKLIIVIRKIDEKRKNLWFNCFDTSYSDKMHGDFKNKIF